MKLNFVQRLMDEQPQIETPGAMMTVYRGAERVCIKIDVTF
jgi:hypothetical protein